MNSVVRLLCCTHKLHGGGSGLQFNGGFDIKLSVIG